MMPLGLLPILRTLRWLAARTNSGGAPSAVTLYGMLVMPSETSLTSSTSRVTEAQSGWMLAAVGAGFFLAMWGGGGRVEPPTQIIGNSQTHKCPTPMGGGGGLLDTHQPNHPPNYQRQNALPQAKCPKIPHNGLPDGERGVGNPLIQKF